MDWSLPSTEVEAEPGDWRAEVTVVNRLPASGLMSSGLWGPPNVAASSRLGSIMDILGDFWLTFNWDSLLNLK